MSKQTLHDSWNDYRESIYRAEEEVQRHVQGKLDLFEEQVLRSKEEGMSLRAITTAYGAKGRDRVYDILDRKWPGWREESVRATTVVIAEEANKPKNFRMDGEWAMIDLYWPGSENASAGYYTYEVTNRGLWQFHESSVRMDDLDDVLGVGEGYWSLVAIRAFLDLPESSDKDDFQRLHIAGKVNLDLVPL